MLWFSRAVGSAVLVAVCVLAGCSHDPNQRKQAYFDSGQRYFKKANYKSAQIQYMNALQIDPYYADAHYHLAQTYTRMGAWQGAYTEYRRTVQLNPQNADAWMSLANISLSANRPKEAEDIARTLIGRDARNADAHALLARAKAAQGNYDAALKEVQQSIDLAPRRSEFYVELGTIQASANHGGTEESFKKAMELAPGSPIAAICLATYYGQQKEYAKAEREFKRTIALDPGDPQPRMMLAQLYGSQGRHVDAVKILELAKQDLRDNAMGYRMLGEYYVATGDIGKATQEFASLHQWYPKDLGVSKTYVDLLILQNQLQPAKTVNDQILAENQRDNEALVFKAAILTRQKRPEEARPILEGVLKSNPNDFKAGYELGLVLDARGDSARAQNSWLEALKVNPSYAPALLSLCEMALRNADVSRLLSCSEKLIQLQPQSSEGYLYRASVQLMLGKTEAAESDLRISMQRAPQSPAPYIKLGELLLLQKQFRAAQSVFEQALVLDRASADALQGLVGALLGQQRDDAAVARVEEQIAKSPKTASFYVTLGSIHARARQFDEAKSALTKALELDPNSPMTYMLLGQVEVSSGAVAKAVETWRQWQRRFPRDARAPLMLGAIEEAQGRSGDAEQSYRQAFELQSDNPIAANNLAYVILQRGGNLDVALSLAQTARRGMPRAASTADTLGWAYYRKGMYSSALDLLKEAVRQAPENETYKSHLAKVMKESRASAIRPISSGTRAGAQM